MAVFSEALVEQSGDSATLKSLRGNNANPQSSSFVKQSLKIAEYEKSVNTNPTVMETSDGRCNCYLSC